MQIILRLLENVNVHLKLNPENSIQLMGLCIRWCRKDKTLHVKQDDDNMLYGVAIEFKELTTVSH